MNEPLLTIVVVHFNTAKLTGDCVDSLLRVLHGTALRQQFEIVIVDNRSRVEEFRQLQGHLAKHADAPVQLVRNCMNSGFGLGCMLGLNYSAGKYVAFVNSDTAFDDDCFTPLIRFMEERADAGVVTPQHLDMEGRKTPSFRRFDSFLQRFAGDGLARILYRGIGADPKGTYTEPVVVDFVLGSFMLFRLEALATIGGFDPSLFLYYEEMDTCLRLQKAGYKAYYHPGSSFRHVGGGSAAPSLELRMETLISMLYIIRKNKGMLYYTAFHALLVLQYLLKAPFKQRNRKLLWGLLTLGVPQACSMRARQECNFDIVNTRQTGSR